MAEHRLFFTAFAQNWCENDRQDIAIDSLESDGRERWGAGGGAGV